MICPQILKIALPWNKVKDASPAVEASDASMSETFKNK